MHRSNRRIWRSLRTPMDPKLIKDAYISCPSSTDFPRERRPVSGYGVPVHFYSWRVQGSLQVTIQTTYARVSGHLSKVTNVHYTCLKFLWDTDLFVVIGIPEDQSFSVHQKLHHIPTTKISDHGARKGIRFLVELQFLRYYICRRWLFVYFVDQETFVSFFIFLFLGVSRLSFWLPLCHLAARHVLIFGTIVYPNVPSLDNASAWIFSILLLHSRCKKNLLNRRRHLIIISMYLQISKSHRKVVWAKCTVTNNRWRYGHSVCRSHTTSRFSLYGVE